jgi:hypothetical protein
MWHMMYLLTAIGLTPGGSSTVHIYTQTIHRTTQLTTLVGRLSGIRNQSGRTNWEECGPCPVFAGFTLEFALQLRKKHGKASTRVAAECQLALLCLWCRHGPQCARVALSRLHKYTQTHHIRKDSTQRAIRPTHITPPRNTRHSQDTDIYALGVIRTRKPSKWAAADPRLRPRGQWYRRNCISGVQIKKQSVEIKKCRLLSTNTQNTRVRFATIKLVVSLSD